MDAFIEWGHDYFSTSRPQILDRSDTPRIDWGDDDGDDGDDQQPDVPAAQATAGTGG
jgi:hypothetical protein